MGSIEGVIILSSTNEPILHSHFLHPLPNYPILHADQLAAKIEAASEAGDLLPISFADGIAHLSLHDDHQVEQGISSDADEVDDDKLIEGTTAAQTGSALVHIQHNQIRLAATFSKHCEAALSDDFLDQCILTLSLPAIVSRPSVPSSFSGQCTSRSEAVPG